MGLVRECGPAATHALFWMWLALVPRASTFNEHPEFVTQNTYQRALVPKPQLMVTMWPIAKRDVADPSSLNSIRKPCV